MINTAPHTMNAQTRRVDEFARAVRVQLADLDTAQIEELTEDLESNLGEMLADSGALPDSAIAYATELRESAGLAPAVAGSSSLWSKWQSAWNQILEHPAITPAIPVLKRLAPAWWLLRAYGLYLFWATLLAWGNVWVQPLPVRVLQWVMLLICVAVSMGWGLAMEIARNRGRSPQPRQRVITVLLGVIAVLGALIWWPIQSTAATIGSTDAVYADQTTTEVEYSPLFANGAPLTNVFVYDAEGNPVPSAQLFDQDGNALNIGNATGPEMGMRNPDYTVNGDPVSNMAVRLDNGALAYNVFPQRELIPGSEPISQGGIFGFAESQLRTPNFPQPNVYPIDPDGFIPDVGQLDDPSSELAPAPEPSAGPSAPEPSATEPGNPNTPEPSATPSEPAPRE